MNTIIINNLLDSHGEKFVYNTSKIVVILDIMTMFNN